jgi:hypothetical protein
MSLFPEVLTRQRKGGGQDGADEHPRQGGQDRVSHVFLPV